MKMPKHRPVFLNLAQIHLPAAGFMSILHRASGALLFLLIPVLIYLLQLVLSGEAGYQQALLLLSGMSAQLISFVILWALVHHLLAGIRYLLLDMHVGVKAPGFRYSAWLVMLSAPLLAFLLSWRLLP